MVEMGMPSMRVSVSPGDAVVAREAEAVLVADPQGSVQEQFLDDVLTLMASPPTRTGGGLVRALAALVVQSAAEDVPSLGLVLGVDDHLVVMLVGDVRLRLTWPDGSEDELSGRDATTYVERAVRGAFGRILMTRGDHDALPDPRSSLSRGVVRGGGVSLTPGARVADVPDAETLVDLAPVPAAVEPAVVEPVPVEPVPVEPVPVDVLPVLQHEPEVPEDEKVLESEASQPFEPISLLAADPEPASPAAADEATDEPGVMVRGIMCSRGHFNDPNARFCSRCGISMVHQTHHLVSGIRPPLGVVVADDGSVFALTGDYVLGREPGNAPDAMSGRAVPVPLDDPGLLMSRVHARIRLEGWSVQVEDAGSANGTFVAESAGADWTQLEPAVPRTVKPGARIRLGSRMLTFESHQRG